MAPLPQPPVLSPAKLLHHAGALIGTVHREHDRPLAGLERLEVGAAAQTAPALGDEDLADRTAERVAGAGEDDDVGAELAERGGDRASEVERLDDLAAQ